MTAVLLQYKYYGLFKITLHWFLDVLFSYSVYHQMYAICTLKELRVLVFVSMLLSLKLDQLTALLVCARDRCTDEMIRLGCYNVMLLLLFS